MCLDVDLHDQVLRPSNKDNSVFFSCFAFVPVEASDVQKAIDDAASSFSGVVAVSSLFDG